MSEPHPAPEATQPDVDPAVARAERRLAKLDRLSDRLLEATDAVTLDGSAKSADTLDKLARAVRLTIGLEEALDAALRAYLAGIILMPERPRARVAKAAAADASQTGAPQTGGPNTGAAESDAPDPEDDAWEWLRAGRRGVVRRLTVDVADREIGDPEEFDLFGEALDARLRWDEAYADLDDLPLRDIVEHLCADLELHPDWSLWTGDGWPEKPPFWRPLTTMFSEPSRLPIIGDG
jgi:hypothetical protein